MNKLFLIAIAALLGLSLLIDNSFFKSSTRRVASTHDSTPPGDPVQSADLSELPESEFAKAFKYQLITNSRLVQNSEESGISLGSFYVRGPEGQKNFVCAKYSSLELVYEAEGVAISGDIPKMVVKGPCLVNEGYTSIEPLLTLQKNSV